MRIIRIKVQKETLTKTCFPRKYYNTIKLNMSNNNALINET